jgi:hypothetical protein
MQYLASICHRVAYSGSIVYVRVVPAQPGKIRVVVRRNVQGQHSSGQVEVAPADYESTNGAPVDIPYFSRAAGNSYVILAWPLVTMDLGEGEVEVELNGLPRVDGQPTEDHRVFAYVGGYL